MSAAGRCAAGAHTRGAPWKFLLAIAVVLGAVTGCFSPRNPPCAFTCITAGNLCPDSFTCGTDGLCHRDGAEDVCGLSSPYDAGADTSEAGTD
jgi:hypothetical protein